MKCFFVCLSFFCLFFTSLAQEASTISLDKNDIVLKLDRRTGKIDLYHQKKGQNITEEFTVDFFELEIYDAEGQYAGTLELENLMLPADEIDLSEKLKIVQARFKHSKSAGVLSFANIDFD